MALACTFALNAQPMSSLDCRELGCMAAFSGTGAARNNPRSTGVKSVGPLPRGRYYIVDRQSGGMMGGLRHFVLEHLYGTDRSSWFALYRDDGTIDDVTSIEGINRGAFRLHPVGPRGLSEGCITLASPAAFTRLRALLKAGPTIAIPNTTSVAYGTVDVT